MQKEEKVDHGIRTVFSISGVEDVEPIAEDKRTGVRTVATISPGETVKAPKPTTSEEIRVCFVYERGDFITGEKEEFLQKIVDAVYRAIKETKHSTFAVRSVNVLIPE